MSQHIPTNHAYQRSCQPCQLCQLCQPCFPYRLVVVDVQGLVLADHSHGGVSRGQSHLAGQALTQRQEGVLDKGIPL